MKLAKQSTTNAPATEKHRPIPLPQPVAVARSAGKPLANVRREPPKPPPAKPKLSDFETELLAAWDS